MFSNKQTVLQKNIIIVENVVKRWQRKLNNFFIEAVENLEIESFAPITDNNIHTKNIDEITKKYEMNKKECKR